MHTNGLNQNRNCCFQILKFLLVLNPWYHFVFLLYRQILVPESQKVIFDILWTPKICTCLYIKIMFIFSADSGWPGLLCYILHNETVVYRAWRRLTTGGATPPVGAIWPSRNASQGGRLGSGSARHNVVNDDDGYFVSYSTRDSHRKLRTKPCRLRYVQSEKKITHQTSHKTMLLDAAPFFVSRNESKFWEFNSTQ